MCVELACDYGRQLPPGRYLEVQLSEMSPELMASILDFCQLENTPEMQAGFAAQFNPELTTQRRQQADPQDLAVIQRWIGPTMNWLEAGG